MMASDASSYIDYETFLAPSFSATRFANNLVLATNDTTDNVLDLRTALSRVLFDVQEVNTHIDQITTHSTHSILSRTERSIGAGTNILKELESQVHMLNDGYTRLFREVVERYDSAEENRLACERLWQTVRLGRSTSRCLTQCRQLEAQIYEIRQSASSKKLEDYKTIVRAANSLQTVRAILHTESSELAKLAVIRTLETDLLDPAQKLLTSHAEQTVSQFSMSAISTSTMDPGYGNGVLNQTYAQSEDTKSRTTAALTVLYLLSPLERLILQPLYEPVRLINILQDYLKRAITSSLAGLSNALAALQKLERILLEISARCQNIAALELLLESIKPPSHPFLLLPDSEAAEDAHAMGVSAQVKQIPRNFLQPVLTSLDTPSLPSYFWRTIASQLSSRVQKILKEGGVAARALRTNREKVRDSLRDCVNRGSQLPASSLNKGKGMTVRNWEREAAVMTGALNAALGR